MKATIISLLLMVERAETKPENRMINKSVTFIVKCKFEL